MSLEKLFSQKSDLLLHLNDQCLLYGAGNIGLEMIDVLKKVGVNPIAFLDSQKSGFAGDLPIYQLDSISDNFKKYPVIISVFSHPSHCSLQKITERLQSYGFQRIISFESFFCAYHNYFDKTHYWLGCPDYFRLHKNEIISVGNILADNISRELYEKQILFRLTGDAAFLPASSPVEQQYFDPSVYTKQMFHEFWDLGAYTGDTLANASNCGKRFQRVIAFEPDMKNYIRLCQYLEGHKKDYDSMMALPLAVGKDHQTLRFMESAFSNAAVSCEGNSSIPSVALDSAFFGASPDFIKLDIEGSEYSALKGMQNILRKNRPLLAVCIYHCPDDFWKIPLFLNDLLEGYSFHIRCYGEHLFDTVLYAVPESIFPAAK